MTLCQCGCGKETKLNIKGIPNRFIIGHNTRGQVAWNKDTKGIMKSNSGSFKKGIPKELHPRGMKGKHHTQETKQLMSDIAKKGDKCPYWRGGRKLWKARCHSKRRELGFEEVNKPLHIDDEVAHHLTKDFVAYVPEFINKSVPHNIWTGKNMDEVNFYTLNYLFLIYNKGK